MLRSHAKLRLALFCVGLFAALFLPAWIPATVIVVSAFFWRSWEALLLGLLMDFLWLPLHSFPWFTIGAIVIVWFFEPIRAQFLPR